MTASILNLHSLAASIDFGAVGGSLLLFDMVLFGALAMYWEEAGRLKMRRGRGTRPSS